MIESHLHHSSLVLETLNYENHVTAPPKCFVCFGFKHSYPVGYSKFHICDMINCCPCKFYFIYLKNSDEKSPWNLSICWLIFLHVFFLCSNSSDICLVLHSFQTCLQFWRNLLVIAFFPPYPPFVLLWQQFSDSHLTLLKLLKRYPESY